MLPATTSGTAMHGCCWWIWLCCARACHYLNTRWSLRTSCPQCSPRSRTTPCRWPPTCCGMTACSRQLVGKAVKFGIQCFPIGSPVPLFQQLGTMSEARGKGGQGAGALSRSCGFAPTSWEIFGPPTLLASSWTEMGKLLWRQVCRCALAGHGATGSKCAMA
jgi:hypothetical protein